MRAIIVGLSILLAFPSVGAFPALLARCDQVTIVVGGSSACQGTCAGTTILIESQENCHGRDSSTGGDGATGCVGTNVVIGGSGNCEGGDGWNGGDGCSGYNVVVGKNCSGGTGGG